MTVMLAWTGGFAFDREVHAPRLTWLTAARIRVTPKSSTQICRLDGSAAAPTPREEAETTHADAVRVGSVVTPA